jgi:hypothetical protein
VASSSYDIRASLYLQAKNSANELRRVSRELRDLGREIRGSSNAAQGLFHQLVGVGGAYFGIRTLSNAFRGLVGSSVAYTSELEKTKIGLQAVISGVEEIPWEEAGRRGDAAFKRIRDLAILSPATSQEMFSIFQGIIGPIEAAGFSMQKVLDVTNDTVLAASALNVDYAQASRDISMMARGTAGMDVKLFSILRSTGAIKENAEEWNKSLTATQRIEKLSAALKKFSASGKAFGSSWAGVTSTFKDIVDNMKASAFGPIMKVIGRNLERFNGYILAHRTELEAFFSSVGRDVGFRLQSLFDKAQNTFGWIVDNWGTIVSRFDHVLTRAKEVVPALAKAALAWQAIQLTRDVVGMGVSAAGAVGGVVGMFGGGAAAGSGAAATGAGAVGAGAGGAAAAVGASIWPAVLAFAAAAAVVGTVVLAVKDNWQSFTAIFGETSKGLLTEVIGLGQAMWKALGPVLKTVGNILLAVLAPTWLAVTTALRGMVVVLTAVFDAIGWVTNAVYDHLKPAFDFLFSVFADIAKFINDVFSSVRLFAEETKNETQRMLQERAWGETGSQRGLGTEPQTNWDRWNPALVGPLQTKDQVDLSKAPKAGVHVTNDFRGSRVQIRQDFKGDTDPDRVVEVAMRDLTRQSEMRVSSGFSGAFTR